MGGLRNKIAKEIRSGRVAAMQARRMKDLEKENGRLKRLVADLSLEKQVLKDIAEGNL
jgi:putative transposase